MEDIVNSGHIQLAVAATSYIGAHRPGQGPFTIYNDGSIVIHHDTHLAPFKRMLLVASNFSSEDAFDLYAQLESKYIVGSSFKSNAKIIQNLLNALPPHRLASQQTDDKISIVEKKLISNFKRTTKRSSNESLVIIDNQELELILQDVERYLKQPSNPDSMNLSTQIDHAYSLVTSENQFIQFTSRLLRTLGVATINTAHSTDKLPKSSTQASYSHLF